MGTDSLTRNDILDIVVAVVQAIPNPSMTAYSPAGGASLQNQPSHSADSANPTIQAVLPDEELQHQELGTW